MSTWHVHGGRQLHGDVHIQGAKNAVLPVLAATVMCAGRATLSNCPNIRDVENSLEILECLGCDIEREADVISVDSGNINCCTVPRDLMAEMRSSVIFLGAMLARCGDARIALPGGCELGARPVDIHLSALEKLGAEVTMINGIIRCCARKLHGADITLPFPSVGATENVMLAACGAEGVTVIRNAAREPEIEDLQRFLRLCGADITGAGTSEIIVHGMVRRGEVSHRIIPDRIAASTYMCAAAACGGEIRLLDVVPEHFESVSHVLEEMGCRIAREKDSVQVSSCGILKAPKGTVITDPYPGFPTDAQPLVMAVAMRAPQVTSFEERIFENRFRQAEGLSRFGAQINVSGRLAQVTGRERLNGAYVSATDLRGGASLIIAALAADGESVIYDSGHIERGYDSLDVYLRKLDANITKE